MPRDGAGIDRASTQARTRHGARHQISVNCVCPGPTDTPLLDSVPDKLRESLVKAIPFRRLAQPQEVADAVLFFASDRARYITGQVLPGPTWERRTHDGGLSLDYDAAPRIRRAGPLANARTSG